MRDTIEIFSGHGHCLPLPAAAQQRNAVSRGAGQLNASPVSAALLEFDLLGRLRFATREAQTLLGFALEPLWGRSISEVLARVERVDSVERITGGRIERPAHAESPATEGSLGALCFWLELQLASQPSEWVTLWFRSQPANS